jgi:GTPase Era involved in 16S rRNA processing
MVREKLLELTGEELPFATAVRTGGDGTRALKPLRFIA